MPNENEQSTGVKINRGKLGSISLYEVTEDELNILERGSPSSTYLNFSIGLLSIGISFFISIFSTKIDDLKSVCGVLGYRSCNYNCRHCFICCLAASEQSNRKCYTKD